MYVDILFIAYYIDDCWKFYEAIQGLVETKDHTGEYNRNNFVDDLAITLLHLDGGSGKSVMYDLFI